MSVRGLGRTFSPASLARWLGHPGQQSSDFFLLLPSIPSRLGPSLPLIRLVTAVRFLPPLQYHLLPCLLSAAPSLLITLHLSTSVPAPCATPTHCSFPPEALLFPFLSSHHSISLNLASIGHSLPPSLEGAGIFLSALSLCFPTLGSAGLAARCPKSTVRSLLTHLEP